jgi:hypothetical protein
MKISRTRRQGQGWEIILAGALLFALIWASSRPSAASESQETIQEGYYGSERIKLIEKPVRPNSAVTAQKGWIGDKRIDLKVIRKNEYTETKGWVEGERVKIRERKDD